MWTVMKTTKPEEELLQVPGTATATATATRRLTRQKAKTLQRGDIAGC